MTTFLITGANRGIGLQLATQALAAGHQVIAGSRHPDADSLRSLQAMPGKRLEILSIDVGDPASIAAAAASLGDRPIDVLVNNAGIIGPERQSALDMDFEGLAETLRINAIGPLRVAQAFLPALRRSKAARIVTISSSMGSMASSASDRIAYRASKATVNKLMQGLASDLKRDGIVTIVMHPGWVQTDMGGAGADITPQDSASGILKVIEGLTLARTGQFIDHDGRTMPW